MCGRNSLFPPAAVLEDRFNARMLIDTYQPHYNIVPGETQPVITNEMQETIQGHTWGFAAPWQEEGRRLINARAETAPERKSFREAWQSRPCLVLSSGFYEWQERRDGPKQPYRIHRPDDQAFALAGLWNPADNGSNGEVTILTTKPNPLMADIHDRMPVVLPRREERTWLTGDPDVRASLCKPYPEDDLEAYPIARTVNDPSHDDAELIEPIDDPQTGLDAFG